MNFNIVCNITRLKILNTRQYKFQHGLQYNHAENEKVKKKGKIHNSCDIQ